MVSIKRLSLDLSLDEMPLMLGLASSLPEYSFAYFLDKHLGTTFKMTGYYNIYIKKNKTFYEFPQYEYEETEMFRFYRLISNKCDGLMLLDKYGALDYLLFVFGNLTTSERLLFSETLRCCPVVQFVTEILLDEREHRDLLVR